MVQDRYRRFARYRDDRLHAVALDPNRLWVYWDEGTAVQRIASRGLQEGWESLPRYVRVSGTDGEARMWSVAGGAGSIYVESDAAGDRCRVEYGIGAPGGFLPLFERDVKLPGGQGGEARLRREPATSFSAYTIYTQA
ncbi:hypothetical protein OS242_12065 [Tumebacillus sp. DT12]|uniref:DUF4912 domain-containing protein n=1 Tax=Tumebacillus lacus TaxID=2995335 RepID=A0ABT3X2M1_9BACL|nr:hypothetical protein [Tumebacillus lacus]MCX7570701.1 hypothetical protein [Tumebacillus lacus]